MSINYVQQIYGTQLDEAGRCCHYQKEEDVVALKCGRCQTYYACFKCHDEWETHHFHAIDRADLAPVMCGACHQTLSYEQYQTQRCPYCAHAFNPGCSLHHEIYFK
ncbi:CHY zinc finger protein [uncultured Enterococcus sp.]|uniref:CHY zinc finger protein n=1 Tax=uncultured Enterococcus sp. TaxID=167972 RepID=UPI0025D05025|nr:CHY zinc finger protein [uncultured Enterococcus sp.]